MSEVITDYPGKDNPTVQAAISAGTWKVKMDKTSSKPFFYNVTTKETTWDLVKTLAKGAAPAPATTTTTPATTTATAPAETSGKKTFGKKPADPATAATTAPAAVSDTTTTSTSSANTAAAPSSVVEQPTAAFSNAVRPQAQLPQQQPHVPYNGVQLSDPIQRLLDHNKKLVGDIATHEAQSITAGMSQFETRLDLLVHANNVLAVQLDRRNQEALAMQRALTEAHDTIHKLRNENKNLEDMRALSYASSSLSMGGGGVNGAALSGEEAKRSVSVALETVGRSVVHLQEQNRSLAATIAQLTSQLLQNVQANNVAKGVDTMSDQPHEWWRNAKGYSVAALTSRFLDSPGRNALCAKCMMRVSDFRDSLLREVPMTEAQKEAQERRDREDHHQQQQGGIFGGTSSSNSPIRLTASGSGVAPVMAARQQPSYVPVNAFRGGGGGGGGAVATAVASTVPAAAAGGGVGRSSPGAAFSTPKSGLVRDQYR